MGNKKNKVVVSYNNIRVDRFLIKRFNSLRFRPTININDRRGDMSKRVAYLLKCSFWPLVLAIDPTQRTNIESSHAPKNGICWWFVGRLHGSEKPWRKNAKREGGSNRLDTFKVCKWSLVPIQPKILVLDHDARNRQRHTQQELINLATQKHSFVEDDGGG